MRKKLFGISVLLFVLVFILAACGGTATEEPAVEEPAVEEPAEVEAEEPAVEEEPEVEGPEEMTISLWTHDQLYVQFFGTMAEEWKENYPNIDFTFDFQVVPDLQTVVLTNLAAGESIGDLIGIEQGMFPNFMRDGIIADKFVDLRPLLGGELNEITEGRYSIYSYEGGVYGAESSLCGVVYYYQPEIFEAYDLDIPTTWTEFIQAGNLLAADGIALSPVTDSGAWFMMYFLQRGGLIFDENGEFVFDSDENRAIAIETLEMVQQGLETGAFKFITGADYWGPAHMSQYEEGKLAGSIMPDWFSDYMLKPMVADMEGQWRIAEMPVWDDGAGSNTTVWGGTGFAVNKESPNVELVYDLLHYAYITKEGQVKRYEQIKYFPTRMDAFEDEAVVSVGDPYFADQLVGQVFSGIVDGIPVWYQSPYRAAFEEQMAVELVAFFEGSTTAEEVVDNVVNFVEDEIAFDE